MTKIPQVKPRVLIKKLQKQGFTLHFWTGSHCQLKHPDGRRVTIPYHPKNIKPGTLSNIKRQLKLNYQQMLEILKSK